jgi:hypothetical protein
VRVEVVVSAIPDQHIVNGDTVFEYPKPQIGGGVVNNFDPAVKQMVPFTSGHIALKARAAIDFRKIEIRKLPQ